MTKYIDFGVLRERVRPLPPPSNFGTRAALEEPTLAEIAPDLPALRKQLIDEIKASDRPGEEKAEAWLSAVAKRMLGDADLEAAIFLASRGQSSAELAKEVERDWHSQLCHEVERSVEGSEQSHDLLARARRCELSLGQIAGVLRELDGDLPWFWSFRDEEELFIASTMLRAAKWLDIHGYEEWWRCAIQSLSRGPLEGVDHTAGAWWLFHWFRSDLALSIAKADGLRAWMWAFSQFDGSRPPWIQWRHRPDRPAKVGFIATAASLLFCAHRLSNSGVERPTITKALDFLSSHQLPTGAWPDWSDESGGSVMATCAAVHALALARPVGWKKAARRAADWLLTAEDPVGCWRVGGGPTVMLTVLALDSIALAEEKPVTFSSRARRTFGSSESTPPNLDGVGFDCGEAPWHAPEPPRVRTALLGRLGALKKIDVAIAVATEVELAQTLRLLRPPERHKHIKKVSGEAETYFLGVLSKTCGRLTA